MIPRRLALPTAQNLVRLLIPLAIVPLIAACGTSPTEQSSSPPSPSVTPSTPAHASAAALPSLPPFDHGDIPAEIVGRYSFELPAMHGVVDLKADGTYVLMQGPLVYDTGTVLVQGEYGVFGDQIRFGNEVSVYGNACPPGDGLYTWSLDGEMLTLAVVDDPCSTAIDRVEGWEAGWTRID